MRIGPGLIGLSLASLQICLMAALGPVFRSGDLAFQFLSVCLLLGHVLGYRCAPRLYPALALLSASTPAFLFALRALSGSLVALALGLSWAILATGGLAFLTVDWWRRRGTSSRRLAQLYSSEMLGAALAFGLALALGSRQLLTLFPWLVAVTLASNARPRLAALCALLAGLQLLTLQDLESWGRGKALSADLRAPARVLEAAYSPYQVVEVVEARGQHYLFLNGLCHHDPDHLIRLNDLLSTLPAQLLDPELRRHGALVLGAGALMSAAETQKQGWPTTVVELDPKVLELSQRHFAPLNGLRLDDPQLRCVANDARAFVHQSQEQFGLIVFSLPYPYSLNSASLFTREFFEQLSKRLHPQGCLAMFLGSPVSDHKLEPTGGSFLRAARQVFPKALGVSSRDCYNTVVYASFEPCLDPLVLRQSLLKLGHSRFQIYDARRLDEMIGFYRASSLWDFRFCARLNLSLWRQP